MNTRTSLLRPAIALTLFYIVVTGLVFPLAVWGLSQLLFPHQANGSLIRNEQGTIVGSELIGQQFSKPEYLHPRPSAAGSGYDAANSGGTNLGPTSDKLINGIPDDPSTEADESFAGVRQLAEDYRRVNGLDSDAKVPVDAVTRSASGLDPHISVENARLQARRVATARGVNLDVVLSAIESAREQPVVGIFGEGRVNVLKLNLALNRMN